MDDVALTGVQSTVVKGDHLCYHSAQKKGGSDFVESHGSDRGYRCLCSLISSQDYSISSFLSNLYKYFTKQWKKSSRFGRNVYCFWTTWFLLCNQFMVNTFRVQVLQFFNWCVKEALEGPHCWVCTFFYLPVNAIWVIAAIWFDASCLNHASGMFNLCRIPFCYFRTS